MKLSAFYIADALHLKKLKETYAGTLLQENPSELFYRLDTDQYCYIFDYGAVVFANMSDVDLSKNLEILQRYAEHPLSDKLRDDFVIIHRPEAMLNFGFDEMVTPRMGEDVIKIAMLNLGASVTLDFYTRQSEELLSSIKGLAYQMEMQGSIRIGQKELLRFIGRTLNSKNRIVENLYIFDSPEQTWDDENLDKVHRGLSRTFELQSRFKEVEYTFKVVEDNLSVFRELFLHRESSKLEWIIIVLILIEVFDLLGTKLGWIK
jgi:required for meiotic nuclear division protein 1